MMEFIMIPLVVGICVAGTYGLFELFARRKERLLMIEKLGDKLDASSFEGLIKFPVPFPKVSFSRRRTWVIDWFYHQYLHLIIRTLSGAG